MAIEEQREQLAEWYDEKYFRNYPHHVLRISQILRHLSFSKSDRVCELGCGLGHVLFAIQPEIAHGLGVDFSPHATAEAIRQRDAAGMHNLEFRAQAVEDLVKDASLGGRFTKVLLMDISEHLYDDTLRQFLATARHLLAPGGRLYIHTPNAAYYLEIMKAHNFILKQFPSHIAVRSRGAYEKLLQDCEFRTLRVVPLPHYNRLLGTIDRFLMNLPLLGHLFEARLLIEAE
jgi:cyclopropane fatty-acyl-phospholipid synthase-like methyltransferase